MGLGSSKIDYSVRAPYSAEDRRFVKSFTLSDSHEDILQFYNLYGFVVFRDVLTEDEINRSIDDLWRSFPQAVRDDPSTWGCIHHPHSFVNEQPIDGLQMWQNRQHPQIHAAFKLLYELVSGRRLQEPLVACLDRGSIMLPTTGEHGRADWHVGHLPHFDCNPFIWHGFNTEEEMEDGLIYNYPNFLLAEGNNTAHRETFPKLRAVLQLSESTETTGGFECVAGFHRSLRAWCESQQERVKPGRPLSGFGWGVPRGDPIEHNMQKITVPAGALIIFSAELPHSMYPNESSGFRYAQYLRMAPVSTLKLTESSAKIRRKVISELLPTDLPVSDIGREVFLLDVEPDQVAQFSQ